jgi:hypothetical protein
MASQRHPSSQGSTMVSATSVWRDDARWWRLLSWVLGTFSSISFARRNIAKRPPPPTVPQFK